MSAPPFGQVYSLIHNVLLTCVSFKGRFRIWDLQGLMALNKAFGRDFLFVFSYVYFNGFFRLLF